MVSSGCQGFKITPEDIDGPRGSLYTAWQMARLACHCYDCPAALARGKKLMETVVNIVKPATILAW